MNKVYIVLGARSGTSFITRLMMEDGVHIGDDFNSYYEDMDFLRQNFWALKRAGFSWKKPPAWNKSINPNINMGELISKKNVHEKWAFKDPMSAFTTDLYLPSLKDEDVYIVGCFRKPEHQAKSIAKIKERGMNYKQALAWCKNYNKRVIRLLRGFLKL